MVKINCLIVEDEPLSSEILEDYVKQVPFLELKGICTDALYAISILQEVRIDLLFLDIHLPKLKGLDFLKSLKNPPYVILTTAYHEYALQGYELNVLDYLLKPYPFNRFLQAVQKVPYPKENGKEIEKNNSPATERNYYFFNVDKKRIKIFFDEILYIESLKEYVRIVTATQQIVTKFQLGQIEEVLQGDDFLRIHRSFIISKSKITAYTSSTVEINGKEIPIGGNYKELVLKMLG